jgi:hypothetical protein
MAGYFMQELASIGQGSFVLNISCGDVLLKAESVSPAITM